MASPNQQLEAALAQFASQPGVAPNQVAQLRTAVTADAQQLNDLNQQAQAGQLKGFALQSAASPVPNLAGIYDLQSGVVTLPASSFQPNGTVASADLKATVKLQEMSIEFAHKTYVDASNAPRPVTQDMVDNLQSTINGSPVLADQIKKAVTTVDPTDRQHRTHLEHFDFIDASKIVAGGTYNGGDKTMRLPALGLQTNSPTNLQGRYDAQDMTFVLGHEIQHGFNHPDKVQAAIALRNEATLIAKSAQPVHDYTAPISAYIQAGREDEAKAEIAGWNALLSREKQLNPNAGLPEMDSTRNNRIPDFIVAGTPSSPPQPKPGLTFNTDGSLAMSPANVAAMGRHYFDRPDPAHAQLGQRSLGIGEKGTSDYPNYYGTHAVEQAIEIERRYAQPIQGVMPRMTINMASVGISEQLLEQEGIDLKANKAPQPYHDTSHTPATQGRFHHTQDGSVNPQHDHQHVPVAPSAPALPARGRRPDDPDHPDHALLEKLQDRVRGLDQQAGKSWDDASERMAASALVMAKKMGWTGQDDPQLVFNRPTERYAAGEILQIFRDGPGASPDPAANRAHMSTTEALSKPAQERYQEVEAINQAQVETLRMAQQQTIGPDDPTRGGPTMRM